MVQLKDLLHLDYGYLIQMVQEVQEPVNHISDNVFKHMTVMMHGKDYIKQMDLQLGELGEVGIK